MPDLIASTVRAQRAASPGPSDAGQERNALLLSLTTEQAGRITSRRSAAEPGGTRWRCRFTGPAWHYPRGMRRILCSTELPGDEHGPYASATSVRIRRARAAHRR